METNTKTIEKICLSRMLECGEEFGEEKMGEVEGKSVKRMKEKTGREKKRMKKRKRR